MTTQVVRSIRRIGIVMLATMVLLAAIPAGVNGASATYQYDPSGRVSRITYDDGTIIDYTYDSNGNRTGATNASLPDTTPPSAPGTPSVTNITMTSATASWTAATDDRAVTGYDYRLNAGAWQSLGNVLSVNLTSLSAATSYTIQVRARDAASNLGPASSNSFATPDTQAPSVPTGLSGSAPNSGVANLSWNASTDNVAVTGYRVYRGGSYLGSSATTSYADTTVAGCTSYSYQVAAYDAVPNVSAASGAINVAVPDSIAPTTPTSLSAAAVSPSQINLSWGGSTDSGGCGLAGYKVYRNGSLIASPTATSFSDTGLASATAYSYTVAAYDNSTNLSPQSNTANATTWSAQPSTPLNLRKSPTTGTGSSYTILWDASSGPISYYILEQSVSGGGFVPFPQINHPTTSKSFNQSCGEYTYRVKGCSSGGACSGYSNQTTKRVCSN